MSDFFDAIVIHMHGLGIENEIVIMSSNPVLQGKLAESNSGTVLVHYALPDEVIDFVVARLDGLEPRLPMDVTQDAAGRIKVIELVTRKWKGRRLHEYMGDLFETKGGVLAALRQSILSNASRIIAAQTTPRIGKRRSGTMSSLQRIMDGYFLDREPRISDNGAEVIGIRRHNFLQYTGSYHVNVTLPHSEDVSDTAFRLMHTKAAMCLQWIEPLLLACTGNPSPLSPLSGGAASSLSVRFSSEKLVAALGKDLAHASFPSHEGSRLSIDLPDLFELSQKHFSRMYAKHVEHLPLWLKMLTSPKYRGVRTKAHEDVVETRSIRGMLVAGTDFRKDEAKGARFGFEFRMLDNCSTDDLHEIVRLLLLTFDHGLVAMPDDPSGADWNAFRDKGANVHVFESIVAGWTTQVSRDYLAGLSRVFRIRNWPKEKRDSHSVLQHIADELHRRYGRTGTVMSAMTKPDLYPAPPSVPNINRRKWDEYFQTRFPDIAAYLRRRARRSPADGAAVLDSLRDVFPKLVTEKTLETDGRRLLAFVERCSS